MPKGEGRATLPYDVVDSPFGPLWVAVDPRGLAMISYGDEPNAEDFDRLVKTYGPGVVPDRRAATNVRAIARLVLREAASAVRPRPRASPTAATT